MGSSPLLSVDPSAMRFLASHLREPMILMSPGVKTTVRVGDPLIRTRSPRRTLSTPDDYGPRTRAMDVDANQVAPGSSESTSVGNSSGSSEFIHINIPDAVGLRE